MKVKELIEKLKGYENFDVKISLSITGHSKYGLDILSGNIIGVGDIGYSDKQIILNSDLDEHVQDFCDAITDKR